MAHITGSLSYMTKDYVAYQEQYRREPRESDKRMIRLIRSHLPAPEGKTLLDIGCHNGNFLFQLRNEIPGLALKGGDLFGEVIEQCQADPDLAGIEFEALDILDLRCPPVDIVVVNAVLFRFTAEQHRTAWTSIARTLNPEGLVFVFDWYHAFHQTLQIVEETPDHPEGLMLNIRSQEHVSAILQAAGFTSMAFYPFRIGIDLPLSDPTHAQVSYTRTLSDGDRMVFRGSLFQPWCHLVAKKGDFNQPMPRLMLRSWMR